MDWQTAFNFVVGIAAASIGWMLRVIYDAISELRQADGKNQTDHNDIHDRISRVSEGLPNVYMRRDDFSAFAGRVEGALARIETKIDHKADK